MYRTIRLSVQGIEIRATVSWLLVFLALAGISIYLAVPEYFDVDGAAAWAAVLITIVLGLAASLTLHEVAHLYVAKWSDTALVAVSPQLAGSLSDVQYEAHDPGTEVKVGVSGPLVSWVLAGLTGGAWWLIREHEMGNVTTLLGMFALVNLGMATVSTMPGYPFDGGRVARGLFWYLSGNLMTATKIVGYIGYALIMGFMTIGVLLIVSGDVTAVWGVWVLVTAYAVNRSVGTGISHIFWSETSRRLRVDDLYIGGTRRIQQHVTIDDAIERMLEGHEEGPLLVFDEDKAVGLVDLAAIRPVSRREWSNKRIGEVMAPIEDLPSTPSSSNLSSLIVLLPPDQETIALITRDGSVIGAADRRDVVRRLQNYLAAERIERLRRGKR